MGAVGEKNKDLLLLLPLVLLALRRRLPLLVSLGLLLGRDLLIETLGTALFIPPRLGEELVLVDGGIVIDLNVRGLQPPLVGRDERRDDFVEEHVGGRTSRDLRGATAVGGGLGGIRQPTLEIRRLAHRSAQHPTERARANGWARPHRFKKIWWTCTLSSPAVSAKVPKKGKRGKCLVVLEYGTLPTWNGYR